MLTPPPTVFDDVLDQAGASPLVRAIVGHARDRGNNVALVFDGGATKLTYRDLHLRALALVSRLADVTPAGRPVLLMVRSDAASVVAICACLYCGIPCIPIPTPTRTGSTERIRAIMANSDAAVIVAPDDAHHLQALLSGPVWLTVGGSQERAREPLRLPHAADLAIIQYTSGSTNDPKGVILTHNNLVANLEMLRIAFSVGSCDSYVSWLPLFHDMGLIMLLMPLYFGLCGTFLTPLSFVRDPLSWLRAVGESGATITGAPNFAYDNCLRRATEADVAACDLSRCRLAFCGAEPIRLSTMKKFAQRFAPAGFHTSALYACYGLAEAVCFVSGGYMFPGGAVPTGVSPGSGTSVACGTPAKGGVVAIVDSNTRAPLEDSHEGEIWIQGEHVSLGYWHDAAATNATFHATLSEDPSRTFLRTGDLGFLLNGVLTVSGRLKDLIKQRGANIHAVDLEATVASSHPNFGDLGAAFAVTLDGREHVVHVHEARRGVMIDVSDMRSAAEDAVAAKHGVRLHNLFIVRPGSLPRTTSGKLRRSHCRQLYADKAFFDTRIMPASR